MFAVKPFRELRSAVSVERRLEGRVSLPRGASILEAFVARQEARKATCVASPPSQSPIGVVKRNRAFDVSARIENANLAGTKSSAGFRIADCLILMQEHGFNAR